ncbi:hypothetical protein JCM10207_000436 [Rhodosporidiobolus poonsookiae]
MDESPPTKASLLKWWKAFTKSSNQSTTRPKQSTKGTPYTPPGRGMELGKDDGKPRVFGVALDRSLQYASVAISMVGPDGKQYVYGYVPIIVAKCGMMLKETATQTEGIFRVSGSNKRINQLQAVFDEPPVYGKSFDWTGYSVHDAASLLRRYLNSLPEPVIPAGLYLDFTAVLQRSQPIEASIAAYRELISLLPPSSRYLLLYLLDFLSVFARCSDKNLMTASNLAVVFQPGLVSPRGAGINALLGFPGFVEGRPPPSGSSTGMALAMAGKAEEQAGEHGRGKEVLEFLIDHQAEFMLDLEPPIDEERQKTKGVTSSPSSPSAAARQASLLPEPSSEYQPVSSTSSAPFDPLAGVKAGGATDLARRGSEKSVERRRLRKKDDAKDSGKVKRSKTWGSSTARRKRGEGREGSPSPNVTPASSSPQQPSTAACVTSTDSPTLAPPVSAPRSPQLSHQPSLKKKPRKSVDAAVSSPPPDPATVTGLAISTSSVPASGPALTQSPATLAPPTDAAPGQSISDSSGSASGKSGGGGLLGFARSKRRSLTPEAKR